jgi:hypothetical protein
LVAQLPPPARPIRTAGRHPRSVPQDRLQHHLLATTAESSNIILLGVLKARFAPYVKNDALRSDNYRTHITVECLEAGRVAEPTIDALLKLLKG